MSASCGQSPRPKRRFWRTQRAFEIQRFLRAGMNVQEVDRDASPRVVNVVVHGG